MILRTTIFIGLLFLVPFISPAQEDCECMEKHFEGDSLTYPEAIATLEHQFIAAGILKGDSASDYVDLVEACTKDTSWYRPDLVAHQALINGIADCFSEKLCSRQDFERIRAFRDSIKSHDTLSPELLWRTFDSVFLEAPFESIYERHFVLWIAYMQVLHFNFPDKDLRMKITRKEPIQFLERDILRVHIDGDNHIWIGDSLIALDSLQPIVVAHVMDDSDSPSSPSLHSKYIDGLGERVVSHYKIAFTCENETHYNRYLAVQEVLQEAFETARQVVAKREYGLDFTYMEEMKHKYGTELRAIRKIIPRRISEAEQQ